MLQDCVAIEDGMQSLMEADPNMSDKLRQYFINTVEERRLSSIEIRSAYPTDPFAWRREKNTPVPPPCPQQAIWFRSRAAVPSDDLFHKCVIAYASDFQFIGTASRVSVIVTITAELTC